MKNITIQITGPAGSGKTQIASFIANCLLKKGITVFIQNETKPSKKRIPMAEIDIFTYQTK